MWATLVAAVVLILLLQLLKQDIKKKTVEPIAHEQEEIKCWSCGKYVSSENTRIFQPGMPQECNDCYRGRFK